MCRVGWAEEEQRYEKKDVAGTRRLLDERGMSVACVTLGFGILKKCSEEAGAGYGTEALGARSMRRQHLALQSSTATWPGSPLSSSWRRRSRRLSTRVAPA